MSSLTRPVVGLGLTAGLAGQLAERFALHRPPEGFDPQAPVIVVQDARVDQAEMDRQPGLKLIAVFGVGVDRVDLAAAKARGLVVTNTPGVTSICVADLAMALLLAAARRIVPADRHVRGLRWPQQRLPLLPRFSGRRLGIYGLGGIGAAIARRAAGFDLEILYHSRRPKPDVPYRYVDSLEALAAACDYLVVACPSTPQTRHSVDARVLAALGPRGIIVNIARGAVIDEAALVEALATGTIAGAGLDVFEREPEVPELLFALDNVVLSPHLAGSTHETWDEAAALVVDNLESFFATGAALTPVAL